MPNLTLLSQKAFLKVSENIVRDEAKAIELKHAHRKMFGYVQHCNITSGAVNIVLCSEASIRLYHELCQRDIVYLDATGRLFLQPKGCNRALYYALVVRHPRKNSPPIPVAECMSTTHSVYSIRLFLLKFKECHGKIFEKKRLPSPKVIMDYSLALIIASVKEFNGESISDFNERAFGIVSGAADDADLKKTIIHVCAAHVLKLNKNHATELEELKEEKSSQIHIAMRFFGRFLNCETLSEMTEF